MKFDDVQKIFHKYIHRRYHRFCRELFAQLLCLNLNIKSAYLFDLFPYSIEDMRNLLNNLSSYLPFRSIILKYSINDLIIMNSSQLLKLIDDTSTSILIIDLNTMTTTNCHPMLDEICNHLSWINNRQHEQIDFDNETNDEWSHLIQSLNHTTIFGYLLGYPLIYFYLSTSLMDVMTLKNFRLSVKIKDLNYETLLYSFSCPIHEKIDQQQIELFVNQWFSSLSLIMNESDMIEHYHLDQHIREQATWCL
ncbi:unnamed protein product [Adineta steineri]|uniref:Uncharacterized protein n=1 Tax=Adineta steineri TaxID=433720 RepID=A0A813YV17_9BILA|nr:unnamed protein product [Adineta steineri]CAF1165045.1 unnamed protein product [Adineta steineri]